ncbi:MAG: carboxypeptidase-like regulatory domain-containing protein [Dysgonamonadaceae bacterium]|jgi:hypothetical protein|nr:carboxypeptidase-like regulatory domain-containing protein [Dysgonamonadaceae bacterium]
MKTNLILLILFLIVSNNFAQRKVSGFVFNGFDNEPIINAEIWEISTTNGTHVNLEGKFELTTTRDTCELRIRYVGFDAEYLTITSDTVITITLREDTVGFGLCHTIYSTKNQLTIGADYDIANSLLGINFNVFHSLPSFHGLGYRISAQTNFKNDYIFDGNIRISSSLKKRIRRLSAISLNYNHKSFSDNQDLNFNKIGVKGDINIWNPNLTLLVEPAFQSLGSSENFGLIVGIHKDFWNTRFSTDLSVGYFNDYWTYSARIQYYLIRKFSLQTSYEKINQYDFLNVGLVYRILHTWR